MKLRFDPYYCPHCGKFKSEWDCYKSYGYARNMEGTMMFCRGCDEPVIRVEPIIIGRIEDLIKEAIKDRKESYGV